MAELLSRSAIMRIWSSPSEDPSDGTWHPVLQVLQIKKMNTPKASGDRFRIILSDGEHFMQTMLATQNHTLMDESSANPLVKNCLIRLQQFATNTVQDRKIIIALDVQVVAQHGDKIGNPSMVDAKPSAPKPETATTASTRPAPAAPAQNGGARPDGRSNGPPPGPIYPIEGLSPYQNKWTIKARVTTKSDIKHWTNARGEGKLFSVNLLDESGEIKATGFNDACDKFYNLLEEGKVFFISKARVNVANKKFTNLSSEYEITFENNTEIEPCYDQVNVPTVKYAFVPLGKLTEIDKDGTCDVIGLVKEVGELTSINSKSTQRPVSKRELTLVDQSTMSVRLTLWGRQAETFSEPQAGEEPIIAFKGVKVSDFGGRSLSMFSSTTMSANPDINEAHALRGWYDSQGKGKTFNAYTQAAVGGANGAANGLSARPNEIKTLAEVKDEQLGCREIVDYFSLRATVVFIRQENMTYPACQSESCNKKVIEDSDGWRCEKCEKTYPAPDHRYIMSFSVNDHTGQAWFSTFNDVGQQILGISANDLFRLKEEDEVEWAAILHRATGKMWNFQCRAKQDNFNDMVRVRYTVNRASPVDFAIAGKQLNEMIEQYGQASI